MSEFPLLFSPLQIGSFTVRNRITSTPHHTLFTDPDGLPGPREIAYWVAKARGGIGLIGSSISQTLRAPALSADSWMARRSTAVEPEGTQTTICGWAKPDSSAGS